MNKIEVITEKSYNTILQNAISALKNGDVVVAPTETRYGLLANASDKSALEKLYQIKNRPEFMPTAIFVKSKEDISKYGHINKTTDKLIKKFLPGPLTIILPAKMLMEKFVVHNNKIGIRFSSAKLISDILSAIDFSLTATSANISGNNQCVSIDEIKNELHDSVELYIDGGILDNDASTVVEILNDEEVVFHRVGAISKQEIQNAIES